MRGLNSVSSNPAIGTVALTESLDIDNSNLNLSYLLGHIQHR